MSDLTASDGMLSGSAASPLLTCLMFSSIVGSITSMGISFSGAGPFKSSSKCFTHLFRCSSISVIDWLTFFVLHRSLYFALFPYQFLRCVT
ncbi:unnamed protein product [Schistosoma margrebowiei]|uniref:Uncharacterized protein n=1 Tax=Schistosoma margrebowiei TaxID=48269 RepID=A0A183MTZ3_9TREM|nr:unnamed protein product [Schistosoma margrebowiei]